MRGYLWNYGCKSCLVWKQRHIRGFGELLLVLEILQDNSNVGNNDKCGSSLVNTGGLAYGGGWGGALSSCTASSILDVGRGPGSVLDIFCIDY